jgi:hypothetical protein
MAAEAICDGCGKRQRMPYGMGAYVKPHDWYQRSDDDGIQVACSRRCIDRIAEKTGKTSVVLPI